MNADLRKLSACIALGIHTGYPIESVNIPKDTYLPRQLSLYQSELYVRALRTVHAWTTSMIFDYTKLICRNA